jgi:RNA polymerase sigma factor (sigma-70 family)
MNERYPNGEPAVLELLASLNSPASGEAWRGFLERYAAQIWRVVRQSTRDPDQASDCFLFVCEKLCENAFRRLKRYEPEGFASFRSWLGVVVANLSIDWQRSRIGRRRPFRNILDLRPLEQRVFHFRFQKGFNFNACLAALHAEFPQLREPELAAAIRRVHETLTPKQHWLLSTANADVLWLESEELPDPPSPTPDPERQSIQDEEGARLNRAMAALQPRQRQLLMLRYRQELTLREIARLTRLGDPFRVRRHIQAALDELARLLRD